MITEVDAAYNDGLEAGAVFVDGLRRLMASREQAGQATGFLKALAFIAGELRGMKTTPPVASIGTAMPASRFDVRPAGAGADAA